MTTADSMTIYTLALPGVEIRFVRTGASVLDQGIAAVRLWHRRIEGRRAIREMTSEQIRDLDLDRFALRREAEKPFWRA